MVEEASFILSSSCGVCLHFGHSTTPYDVWMDVQYKSDTKIIVNSLMYFWHHFIYTYKMPLKPLLILLSLLELGRYTLFWNVGKKRKSVICHSSLTLTIAAVPCQCLSMGHFINVVMQYYKHIFFLVTSNMNAGNTQQVKFKGKMAIHQPAPAT